MGSIERVSPQDETEEQKRTRDSAQNDWAAAEEITKLAGIPAKLNTFPEGS